MNTIKRNATCKPFAAPGQTSGQARWTFCISNVKPLAQKLSLILLILLLLAGCSGFPLFSLSGMTAQKPDTPLAMLIEGASATVKQSPGGRSVKPYQLPFPLLAGDVVSAGKERAARLICDNDRLLTVAANHSLTVSQTACQGGKRMPAGTFEAVRTQAGQPASTARGDIIQSGPRDKASDYGRIPVVLSPRHTALLDPRPTIRWTEVNGAKTYLVTVNGDEGDVIAGLESATTELTYPDEVSALQAGQPYFIDVSACTSPTEPLRQSEAVSVTLLLPERADQVAAFVAEIEAETFDEATRQLLLGGYYADWGLYQMAIAEYEALIQTQPASMLAHQALGNLYLRIGLTRDAFPHYEKALRLAYVAGDLPGQAAAHVGLGQAGYGWQCYDKALSHFETASTLYQEAGLAAQAAEFKEAAETAEHLLKETGSRCGRSELGDEIVIATTPRVEQRIQADLAFAEAERFLKAGERDAAIESWKKAAELYRGFDRSREADAYMAVANAYSPFPVGGEAPDWADFLKRTFQDIDQLLSDLEKAMQYYHLAFQASADVYEELCTPERCFPDLDAEQVKVADALYQQGLADYEAKRYDDAIAYLRDAADVYQAAGYPPGRLRALVSLSQAHFYQDTLLGAFSALLPLFEAFPIVKSLPVGNATDVRYLDGLHAYQRGDWQEAINIWNEVIPAYEAEGNAEQIAVTRTNLGSAYAQSGNYLEALILYAQALPTFEALEDVENQAVVHHDWGNVLLSQGNYSAALKRYELALFDWQAIGDRLGEAASLDGAGFVLTQLGRHQEAEVYLTRALDYKRQLNAHLDAADSLTNLGNLELLQGRYAQAEDYFNQALSIWQQAGNPAKEVQSLSNLAAAQSAAGQVDEALATYDEAWRLAEAQADQSVRAYILLNRGSLHANLGEAQTALGYFHQALTIFEAYDIRAGVATVSTHLGLAYLMVGDLGRGQDWLEKALAEAEAIGFRAGVANAAYALGASWLPFDDGLTEAATHLEAAQLVWQELANPDGQTLTLTYLAYVYRQQGRYPEALAAQTQALDLTAETGNRFLRVRALFGLGLIQVENGELEAANLTFAEAHTLATSLDDVRGEYMALLGQGHAAIEEKNWAAALSALQLAIDGLERWHGLLTVPELKTSFLGKMADVYDLAAYLAYQQGQPDLAFEYVEQSKARALLEQLANLSLRPSLNLDPDLAEQEASLRAEMLYLFRELEKAQTQSQPDQTRLDNLGDQLAKKRSEYAGLLLEVQSQDPAYQAWRHPTVLTLAEIQAQFLAGQEMTLIEYAISPLGALAWVVEGESVAPVALDVNEAMLDAKVRYWYNLVTERGSAQATGQEIYDLIFAPLRPYIHHRRLIVVPHDLLHGLAFAALYDGAHYLVEDYAISYLPSASVLAYLPGQSAAPGDQVLILGDADGSLEYAAAEAQAVAALYGATPLLREQATECSVKEQSGNSVLLHLAVHGRYEPLSPLFSRLELFASDGEDGLLEVHEIYNLDLAKTNLVVLSACHTLKGEISGGDEVSALSRAFLYAGAPLVVGSLWAVDDAATADLMVAFHRGVRAGEEAAVSLQAAQQQVLADPDTAHPYYWAAFGLTGRAGQMLAVPPPTRLPTALVVSPTPMPTGLPTGPAVSPTPRPTRDSGQDSGICGLSLVTLPLLVGSVLALSSITKRRTR